MRPTTLLLATGAAGVFFKTPEVPVAVTMETPEGIVGPEQAALVSCSEDIDEYEKLIFSTIMGCNRKPNNADEAFALCNDYTKGGCDNEHCHDRCHKMYTSQETYKKCKCESWDGATFKEQSAGNMCPLKVQPRCLGADLYRTECEALKANNDKSAGDLSVAAISDWPEGDMSPVKKSHTACA